MIGERLLRKPIKLSGLRVSFDLFIKLNSVRFASYSYRRFSDASFSILR
jgi:hypothetical protein